MKSGRTLPGSDGSVGVSGRGHTGMYSFTLNSNKGGLAYAKSDAYVERRSGSFAEDGKPTVERGEQFLDTMGKSESVNLYFWETDRTITDSYPMYHNAQGLAWDGTYLWNVDMDASYVYQTDTDGNLVGGFGNPQIHESIAWDGDHLWAVDGNSDTIYKYDKSGTILDSISADHDIEGLTYDSEDDAFWTNNFEAHLYKYDRDGTLDHHVNVQNTGINDIAGVTYDGESLWGVDRDSYMYEIDPDTGRVIGGMYLPVVGSGTNSVAPVWDGSGFWYIDNGTADYVYRFGDGGGPFTFTAGVIN